MQNEFYLQLINKDRSKGQSQKHTQKGSMDELYGQSSTKPKEVSFQKLDSSDTGRISDDQYTNLEKGKPENSSWINNIFEMVRGPINLRISFCVYVV
ncbi:hypothetical protein OSB04_005545 [Centaurea solstitialis]|uniref:Uncharacterized protein n=1 Tax=Centaurea solstitialis TaxID=347529 RepID=A0AA38TG84_9ASTR|nr:hypothetical protein OSB04_005545 [Centaurea solstitialis]